MKSDFREPIKRTFIFCSLMYCYGLNANPAFEFYGGILGGGGPTGAPFAALVSPSSGATPTVTTISAITNLSTSGVINSVAMNNTGFAVVGGEDDSGVHQLPIVAFVTPNSNFSSATINVIDVSSLFSSPTDGSITQVAINNSGVAVVSGFDNNVGNTIAALVTSNGSIQNLGVSLPASTSVDAVAINDSKQVLLGSFDQYIATVASDGTVNVVMTAPHAITSVAMNNEGIGIIGSGGIAFAAVVTPPADSPSTVTPISGVSALILDVAINDNNIAFLGGQTTVTSVPYGAYVTDLTAMTPTLTPVTLAAIAGQTRAVDLDSAGNAVAGGNGIGGSPTGWQISPPPPATPNVEIAFFQAQNTVSAIADNNVGTSLMVGSLTGILTPQPDSMTPGTFIPLTVNGFPNVCAAQFLPSLIPPVTHLIPTAGLTGNALAFANYLNQNVPNSTATSLLADLSGSTLKNALNHASPARNAFATFITQNVMLGFSQLISSHLLTQRLFQTQITAQPVVADLIQENDSTRLTADASDRMMLSCPPSKSSSFWIDGFGEYSHLKSIDQNPKFNAYSGAAMMGFDVYTHHNLFGIGAGYAYTHLIESSNAGHEKINYYFASLYDTFFFPRGYVEFGAWGAYNQIHNYRHISFPGFDATASATIHSWQVVPHLGFGISKKKYCWGCIEPFVQADCVISWQKGFQEHGAGPFNMRQKSQTSELLRTEAGFRFYETKETCWGAWMIMEKFSYVYLKTFDTGRVSAAILGTPALFTITTIQGAQNLGSAGLELLWRFGKRKPFTFALTYDGEMNSKYMSHEGMIQLIKEF